MAVRGKKAKERSAEISEKHRNAGNKAFQQRQFDVAAAYYTEAILTAPKDSVVLALAHANRASTCTRPNAFAEVFERLAYIIVAILMCVCMQFIPIHRLAIMIAF